MASFPCSGEVPGLLPDLMVERLRGSPVVVSPGAGLDLGVEGRGSWEVGVEGRLEEGV